MELLRATLQTPVGPMLAFASERSLCALEFDTGSRLTRLEARLAQFYGAPRIGSGKGEIHARVEAWLEHYFAGASAEIGTLPLDARGTPFETAVWAALVTIPSGATTSYGRIAERVGGTAAASRAVGLANGANPIAIIVPCHRVIGANGTLTGYGGGLDRKLWLLQHEERWWPGDTSLSRVSRESRQRTLEFST
jgi:methylated-DNA-[protein]-cysteine S-methyltransferase